MSTPIFPGTTTVVQEPLPNTEPWRIWLDVGGVIFSVALVTLYHIYFFIALKKWPLITLQGLNNDVRKHWVKHVMEIMDTAVAVQSVQTLRNTIQAASMLASASVVVAVGLINYGLVNWRAVAQFNLLGSNNETLILIKFLALFIAFALAFANFVLTIRCETSSPTEIPSLESNKSHHLGGGNHACADINHATFIMTLPVQDRTVKKKFALTYPLVARLINQGFMHHTFGTRFLYLSFPVFLWAFGPVFMMVSTVFVLAFLIVQDHAVLHMRVKLRTVLKKGGRWFQSKLHPKAVPSVPSLPQVESLEHIFPEEVRVEMEEVDRAVRRRSIERGPPDSVQQLQTSLATRQLADLATDHVVITTIKEPEIPTTEENRQRALSEQSWQINV